MHLFDFELQIRNSLLIPLKKERKFVDSVVYKVLCKFEYSTLQFQRKQFIVCGSNLIRFLFSNKVTKAAESLAE